MMPATTRPLNAHPCAQPLRNPQGCGFPRSTPDVAQAQRPTSAGKRTHGRMRETLMTIPTWLFWLMLAGDLGTLVVLALVVRELINWRM